MADFAELAATYGTPLYVYDLDAVDDAVARLRGCLPEAATIHYSLKANPHVDVARRLARHGLAPEISSEGELSALLDAGFDAASALYTGPAKGRQELRRAIEAGVRTFSVESATDFARVADVACEAAVTVSCWIRVSPGVAGSSGLRMTGPSSHFGVPDDVLLFDPGLFAKRDGACVTGLHFFTLSNARDEDALVRQFATNISVARRVLDAGILDVSHVDLGGGFAAPYAEPGELPAYAGLRATLGAELDRQLPGWRQGEPAISFESGRYLVGTCGVLVTSVVDVRRGAERVVVYLDAGINHLGGLSGLGRMAAQRGVVPVRRGGEASSERVQLVGPLCTPADVLSRECLVDAVQCGDLLAIPAVGAYGLTASLVAFLGRPTPAEVVTQAGTTTSATRLRVERTILTEQEGRTT